VGRAEVEAGGGRVVRVALVPGRSSSAIVARIRRP
jgi:bifunctional ADP-heptose synthase (sugar kinase/adenylyltransferase)